MCQSCCGLTFLFSIPIPAANSLYMSRNPMNSEAAAGEEEDEAAAEREEAEDDAPEAVQAQNQQSASQQWSTYPDLLRVQRSKSRTNSVAGDHPPEGQEPGSSRAANSVPAPAPRPVPISSQDSRRDTGTVPKRVGRLPPPPDLTSRRVDVSRVPAPRDDDARVERLEREVDQLRTERVALQQQRSTDEAKEAELRHISDVQVQLLTIAASVQSLNQMIHSMSQAMNRRLDQLDSRLNSLVSSGSSVSVDAAASLRQDIESLIQSQRREIAQERSMCLASVADALRAVAAQTEVAMDPPSASSKSPGDSNKRNSPL